MPNAPDPIRAEDGREAGQVAYEAWVEGEGLNLVAVSNLTLTPWRSLSDEAKAIWEAIERKSAARAEAEVARLKEELGGWQRVAVIAAIPLEAMRMSGSYRTLAPTTQASVDEAVITIRLAVSDKGLPPYGDVDACLAPARAALHGGDHDR